MNAYKSGVSDYSIAVQQYLDTPHLQDYIAVSVPEFSMQPQLVNHRNPMILLSHAVEKCFMHNKLLPMHTMHTMTSNSSMGTYEMLKKLCSTL